MPGELDSVSDLPDVPSSLPSLPFPEPDKLKEYEAALPGFGHRWMTAWERALDRSFDVKELEITEGEKTARRAWYTRELRLVIFGVLSITYFFIGIVIGFDSRAMTFLAIVAVASALEATWRRIRRKRQVKRETSASSS